MEELETSGYRATVAKYNVPRGTLTCWGTKQRRAREQGLAWPPEEKNTAKMAAAAPSKTAQEKKSSSSKTFNKRAVARRYTPSQKAQAIERVAQVGVSQASRELGISRFSLQDWVRKERLAAQGKGVSPSAGPDPLEQRSQRDREILSCWREHPGLGPSQVVNQLRRKGIKVSVHTARKVMEDAGYRTPKVTRQEHNKRFTSVRPNHMWHLDFVHRYIGSTPTFTLILIDDCSRFVVGHGVDEAEKANMVIKTFEEAVERHGRPEFVMHDKGSAFWSWRGISRFTKLLEEMEVNQVVAKHKEWNGKVEVFNGNLHKEFFNQKRFYDVNEMERRLAHHLHWYNHKRTHHALGGLLVPSDRYYGRSEEVLARIEAGAGQDPEDPLSLASRVMELFKITSTKGVPEVYLMGQKLLGGES